MDETSVKEENCFEEKNKCFIVTHDGYIDGT